MRRLLDQGVTTFVEVGPGTVLTGLGRRLARTARWAHFEAPEDLAELDAVLRA